MSAKPRVKGMPQAGTDSIRIDRTFGDIIESALTNDFRGVDTALAHGQSINSQRQGSGITPLMAASGRGLDRMVKHLLAKDGIRLDLVDDFGKDVFEHGRIFPGIVSLLVMHKHPNMRWQEPGIFPVP